ncbi:uncharacterized protein LOC121972440 [Zingiber officinale]|uniref:uncharacterized protein LOC121972440 n=1 Tax=Zingiber officinale TaxID=94328 RepID=UPI001C4C0613|nr:uncharacterized protein LOC121972440 [Zingiber officinale]
MDLDLALRTKQSTASIDTSSSELRAKYEKWDRSNRMNLMIIKHGISEAFRGAVSNCVTKAKEYLDDIEKRFAKSNKVETNTILKSLISMKYKGKENIQKYIMEMSHLTSKLKALNLELSDGMHVHLVLISFPNQFSQFQINYNCQKEKWTLNKLISYCVQEKERLKQNKSESVYLARTPKYKGNKRKNEATKGPYAKK